MPDKYGHELKAGDRVLFTAASYAGLLEGVMKYDEGEKAKYHLVVDYTYADGRVESTTKHYNKLKGNDHCIIKLAPYVQMLLDQGLDLSDA